MKSKLSNGLILSDQECPFKFECLGPCYRNNTNLYHCKIARGLDILDMVFSADDKTLDRHLKKKNIKLCSPREIC